MLLSKSLVTPLSFSLSSFTLSKTFSLSPIAPIIVAFSLSALIFVARPKSSSVISLKLLKISPEIYFPPTARAISSKTFFLLSPKYGVLIATQLKIFLILLITKVVNASPSISSAIINKHPPTLLTFSITGKISWIEEIFLSVIKIYGFSSSAIILL